MNIWIFNHYAQGPELPGGTRHYDLGKELVKKGHQVTIFAAGFHYTLLRETVEYNKQGYQIEYKDGVRFLWVKTFPYRKNDIKRMFNITSYAWKLNFLIPKLNFEKPDIIIGSTVHPFAPIIACKLAKKFKVPFVFEIRDLWPQTFIDMGLWNKNSFKSKFFFAVERYCVKKSNAIIILSPLTKKYLLEKYSYKNCWYIPNGIDLDYVKTSIMLPDINPTILKLQKLKDQGKKIFMFTGAIVKSNNINMLIEASKKIKFNDIQIVLVGNGQERRKYEQIIANHQLSNIIFLDPVEKRLVHKLLNKADVLLLVQGDVRWGSSNKLYDYLASKKPIITSILAKHNDIVENIGCGFSSGYNIERFLENVQKMYRLSEHQKAIMGENAYNYVYKNHDIKILAEKLENLCRALIQD